MKFETSMSMKILLSRIDRFDPTRNYLYCPDAEKIVDEKSLLEILRDIYSQEYLTVYNQRDSQGELIEADKLIIKKKARARDLIVCKDSKGVVKYVDNCVDVAFKSVGIKLFCSPRTVYVIGRKGGLFRREKRYPRTRGDFLKIKKKDIITTAADRFVKQLFLPDYVYLRKGTEGFIQDWVNIPLPDKFGYDHYILCPLAEFSFSDGVRIKAAIDPEEAIVMKKNEVDFERLYRECFWEGGT